MRIKTDGTIGIAIAIYTGHHVVELDVVQDPVVKDCTAIRTVTEPCAGFRNTLFFLVRNKPLHLINSNDLEEVEFTEWPPTSRG